MTEFEHNIGYSKCCDAKLKTNEPQTIEVILARSSDMCCSSCRKSVMPHEVIWKPEYLKIDNGIYRKIN